MKSRPDTMILLTPAFPADESETSWVTTQQVFVRVLHALYPWLTIRVVTLYYPDCVCSYDWRGMTVDAFQGMKDRRWRRGFFWRRVWQGLQQIRQSHTVLGVLSFWCGETALLGHYFGKRYGIPHYCWLCGQDARPANWLVRWIRPKASELIGMSDALVREFERSHGVRPAHMVPNGIDPGGFGKHVTGHAAYGRDIDILGAGSLSPLKQYDVFVEVVAAVRTRRPLLAARHCGSGTEKKRVAELIREKGLIDSLHLLGEQGHADVLGLMTRTRVFLHTSGYEGFGVVCMEALYAGAQVISFVRPMDEEIPGWHIVQTKEEMAAKAIELLAVDEPFVAPRVYFIQDAVRAIMGLYGI